MRWFVYNVLFAIAYAAMLPSFLRRMKKRGGYRAHFSERFGKYDPETARRLAEKPRVWIHAVSVGEANLAGTVIRELRRRDPSFSCVFSTTSSTGRGVCEKIAGPDDVVIYLPLDFPRCVRRALAAVNATALVLTESELWPNLLRALRRKGVPLLLLNGRVSDRSAPGYRRLRFFFGPVLRCFDVLLAQSPLDRDRLVAAGAPPEKIRVTGSVKFDVPPPAPDALARARGILSRGGVEPGRDLVLLGGSTWPGEELALARAWRAARAEVPALRLVLVPRHAERAAEVAAELQGEGFAVERSSRLPDRGTAGESGRETVLLVDETGVLFPLYSFADLVFVGKTLAPNEGGQNMIEPASFGKPVVLGPHTENFAAVMETFRAAGAVLEVADPATLAAEVLRLTRDAAARAALGARADAAVAASRGALARSCDAIEVLLPVRFGLVADPHVADLPDALGRHYRLAAGRLEAAAKALRADGARFLVEMGDLKDAGPDEAATLENLAAAAGALRAFGGPVEPVLGNHDVDRISKAQFLRGFADGLGLAEPPAPHAAWRVGAVTFVR
ncbi:MAG: metallophosphoesterase, partial [Kiritimatiellae bacterium]|nr:metallophosphoesterase [Kiritimatiellia bacterium]